jgi:DNA-binding PucR family transcriptional regulator
MAQQTSTFERLQIYKEKWMEPKELPGRPPLASTEVAAKILKYLAQGNYLTTSCAAAGVSYKAVREWVQKAARDREAGITSPYTEFADTITHAEAAAETSLVERLNVAEDWRAQSFLLERRHKERWGKAEQQQQAQQVLVISEELAAGMLEALRAATAAGPITDVMSTNPNSENAAAIDASYQQLEQLPERDED